jgi:small-conductance mechanosensitive channel
MLGWTEILLMLSAAALFATALLPAFRAYRALILGGAMLLLITALFPRQGNLVGQYLFLADNKSLRLPMELFGFAWWILGAWLLRSLFQLLLRHTLFPDDDEPHARRLFADLVSLLIYIVAIVGILETVLKQPISTVLATSGVLAIILGLALQSTISDVFSGLAINIDRPFGAGDWITLSRDVEGQVIQINWRSTRIKSASNDIIVVPNSVVAKATVISHRRRSDPRICTIELAVVASAPVSQVIEILEAAAAVASGISIGTRPTALACAFQGAAVAYKLSYEIDEYPMTDVVTSEVIARLVSALQTHAIPIGQPPLQVQVGREGKSSGVAAATAGPLDTPMRTLLSSAS